MNYYIDFDNTLYETAKLTALMLGSISKGISEKQERMQIYCLKKQKQILILL